METYMFWDFPLEVQACDTETNSWYTKTFETKAIFLEFIQEGFKESPDLYKLKNTRVWKATGQVYADTVTRPNFEGGNYQPGIIRKSEKYKKWTATEKDRVLKGVIYDGKYLPPFYYWYLNFCPIFDDLKKKRKFPDVWDSDLWYMQYVMLAILQGKHVGGVKGRQKGYSFKHMAILYWSYCWFESSVNTIGAYTEDLVKKSWRFLEGYRAHINANTPWIRGPYVPKSLEWNEVQMDENGKPRGLQSKLAGVTFKQRPDNDVGGSQTFFNYEEPGVSPTILETLEFVRPALEKGSVTTGTIIACGSVGSLDDAEGLKTIFYEPDAYNFLGIKNIWDENSTGEPCCIFISEAYNMIGDDDLTGTGRPFMDEDGNSDVELALKWIAAKNQQIKRSNKKAELKQLALSQKCTSPKQAFDERTLSEFPVERLRQQQERIKLKNKDRLWEKAPLKCLLVDKGDNTVGMQTNNLPVELEYPINAKQEDKRGVWTLFEIPEVNPKSLTYFAGIDPVEVDVTNTSNSVASIDIFKTAVKVQYTDAKGKDRIKIEGDKLVACYRGRFDDIEKTNEQIWLGMKLFNAFGYAERNKPNFINYMKRTGRAERYLAKESDVPIFKDLNIKNGNFMNNSKFGFHMGDNTEIWKHFKNTVKEYMITEYGRNTIEKNGNEELIKIFTGIDRIDDYWLLEEFIKFVEGKGNYDRLVSFMAGLFLCKVYQQSGFTQTRDDRKKEKPKEQYVQRSQSINMLGNSGFRTSTPGKKQKPYSML